MQKNLLMLAAALVGVGAAAWLLMPEDRSSGAELSTSDKGGDADVADEKPQVSQATTIERKDPEEEERYVHPAAEEAAERLKTPFAQFALSAGPQWNALAYELRKAGGDEELAAACKEMTAVLRDLRRDEEPDVDALLAEQQALLERVRAAASEVPAMQPSIDKLVTLLAGLADGDEGADDGEPVAEQ